MRLRSDIWVSAYLRRCGVEGASAVLRRRGAAEAGAIFVKVDHLNGRATLYGPAPQSVAVELKPGVERIFTRAHNGDSIDSGEAEQRLNGAGRLLVRASGTEPIIRIMAEGDDEKLVGQLVREIAGAVREAAV